MAALTHQEINDALTASDQVTILRVREDGCHRLYLLEVELLGSFDRLYTLLHVQTRQLTYEFAYHQRQVAEHDWTCCAFSPAACWNQYLTGVRNERGSIFGLYPGSGLPVYATRKVSAVSALELASYSRLKLVASVPRAVTPLSPFLQIAEVGDQLILVAYQLFGGLTGLVFARQHLHALTELCQLHAGVFKGSADSVGLTLKAIELTNLAHCRVDGAQSIYELLQDAGIVVERPLAA